MIEDVRLAIYEINQELPQYDFQSGDCFLFFLALKQRFPEAVPYYDGDHVYTMIAGRLWDSKGLAMYPMESEPRIFEEAFSWSS